MSVLRLTVSGNLYVGEACRISKFELGRKTGSQSWGKNVNGGGVFGVCTVAADCMTQQAGFLGGEIGVPPPGVGAGSRGRRRGQRLSRRCRELPYSEVRRRPGPAGAAGRGAFPSRPCDHSDCQEAQHPDQEEARASASTSAAARCRSRPSISRTTSPASPSSARWTGDAGEPCSSPQVYRKLKAGPPHLQRLSRDAARCRVAGADDQVPRPR